MADISTLIADVQRLIEEGHVCDEANVEALGRVLAQTVAKRLKEAADPPRAHRLYLSQIGKPDRQVWFDAHYKGEPEKLDASARMKFLFGDILEALLLFLAIEAGHEVADDQKRVVIDGVSGRMDGIIDGVVVDTKSASSYAFKKFKDGSLPRKDDFGYMWQIASYSCAEDYKDGAFFVIDKQLGHICLDRYSADQLKLYDVKERIAEQKVVIALPEPPKEKCFDPVPDGKSGNMKLDTGCGHCKHKLECWKDANDGKGLKEYIYSTGPRWLTKVVKEPRVDQAADEAA